MHIDSIDFEGEDNGTNELSTKQFAGTLSMQLLYKAVNLHNSNEGDDEKMLLDLHDMMRLQTNKNDNNNIKNLTITKKRKHHPTERHSIINISSALLLSKKKRSYELMNKIGSSNATTGARTGTKKCISGRKKSTTNTLPSSSRMFPNGYTVPDNLTSYIQNSVSLISGSIFGLKHSDEIQWDSRAYMTPSTIKERRMQMLEDKPPLIELVGKDGRCHHAVKLLKIISNGKATKGKKYTKPRAYHTCHKPSTVKCKQCSLIFCYPLKDETQVIYSCFDNHMNKPHKYCTITSSYSNGAEQSEEEC